jgi:hypothetical protein
MFNTTLMTISVILHKTHNIGKTERTAHTDPLTDIPFWWWDRTWNCSHPTWEIRFPVPMPACTDGHTNDRKNERTNERTNEWTDGQAGDTELVGGGWWWWVVVVVGWWCCWWYIEYLTQ